MHIVAIFGRAVVGAYLVLAPHEFKDFIGENIRLDPVSLNHLHNTDELLSF
jgi:hypothetical protein